jgi:hypothetical protein
MKFYHGNKVLLNVRLPYAWIEFLELIAKDNKITLKVIINNVLEKSSENGKKQRQLFTW